MDDAVWDPREKEEYVPKYLREMMLATKVVRLDLVEKAKYLNGSESNVDAPVDWVFACSDMLQRDIVRGLVTLARDYVQGQWMRHTWIDDTGQTGMSAEEYCDFVIKQLQARIGGGSN